MCPAADSDKRLDLIQARNERLKMWGSILGIIAAIIASFFAYFRPEEDEGAKDVYKELSKAVEKVSEDQVKLHRDVAAIQGYLKGRYAAEQRYIKDNVEEKKRTIEDKPPISARVAVKPKPAVVLTPPDELLEQKSAPPSVGPDPKPYKPPPIDVVIQK